MARKQANLKTAFLSQDLLPEHWDWTIPEKEKIGNVEEMGQIIKSRLENGGCRITEMYGIIHNTSEYVHIHVAIKGDLKTLPETAAIIGVPHNNIEKPKTGRYSYDNMLAYLIHIKHPDKHQYNPHMVHTFVGRDYMDYYAERHDAWLRGRTEKASPKKSLNKLKVGIARGEILMDDIALDDDWAFLYIMHQAQIDKIFDAKRKMDNQRLFLEKTKK